MLGTDPGDRAEPDPRRLVVAAVTIGTAAMLTAGVLGPVPLAMLVVGAVALAGAVVGRGRAGDGAPGRTVQVAWALQSGAFVAATVVQLHPDATIATFVLGTMLALLIVAAGRDVVWQPDRVSRRQSVVLLGSFAALGLLLLVLLPRPPIDVYDFQDVAGQRLLSLEDPYEPGYPNVYAGTRGNELYYGDGLTYADRLDFGFPYPPLALVASVIGRLLGDVRAVHLGAIAVTGWLLLRRKEPHARLAAAFLLTLPCLPLVLRYAWTEPVSVALLAATATATTTRSRTVFLGLLLASKQTLWLLSPLFWLALPTSGQRSRSVARVVGVAAAVTAPFLVVSGSDFIKSVLVLQLRQPFREDSLSLLGAWNRWVAPVTASVATTISLLGAVVAIGLLLRRAARSQSGFAAALAAAWVVILLLSKQAFANYYFFAAAAALVAVGVGTSGRADPPGQPAALSARPRPAQGPP